MKKVVCLLLALLFVFSFAHEEWMRLIEIDGKRIWVPKETIDILANKEVNFAGNNLILTIRCY